MNDNPSTDDSPIESADRSASKSTNTATKRSGLIVAAIFAVAALAVVVYLNAKSTFSMRWLDRANVAIESRQLDLADQYLDNAHQWSNRSGKVSLLRARVARLKNDPANARRFLTKARDEGADRQTLEHEETLIKAQTGRARILIDQIESLINQSGEGAPYVLEAFALGFASDRDYPAALDIVDRWLAVEPESAMAHYRKGTFLQQTSRNEEAKKSLARAVELNPQLTEAHFALARVAFALQDDALALKHYRVVVAANPDNFAARMAKANLLLAMRKYDEAIEEFNWILERDSDNFSAQFNLASHYARHGEPQKTIDLLADWNRKLPDDVALNYLLANAHQQLGDDQLSESFLQRHLEGRKALDRLDTLTGQANSNLTDFELRKHLGLGYLQYQWDSAQVWLTQANAMRPYDVDVLRGLATYWQINGNEEFAKRYLESAERLQSSSPGN
ncbi:MAG: tetratricopeptide repeat protein [Pirellulaceae bacterium]|nr:tetratricopeptide repeat protein [Pirellulaceae bacterium]